MNDALCNPLVIGNKYGYSVRKNGFTDVVVGTLVKINAQKVSLGDATRREFLYNKEHRMSITGTVSISPQLLFPVSE